MRKAAEGLAGWALVEINGGEPEEFLNLCARKGVPVRDAEFPRPGTARVRVALRHWKKLKRLGGGRWEVKLLRRGGLPGFLRTFRFRYGLLAGLILAVGAVCALSRFVLTVRVEGNRRVPTEAILTQLRAQGVKPGAYGPGLDTRDIAHRVILALPELSWMSVNLHGTVAEVLVREGEPRPEIPDVEAPAHVVARYPGIIVHMDTYRGMALVKEGDTVAAGDTLIAGWVDFVEPEGAEKDWGGMSVRAAGRVKARTWHTLKAAIPLEGEGKTYTGEVRRRWSLEFFGREVKFYRKGGIPFEKCDKMTQYHTVRLPGGGALPISWKREVYAEYETASLPIREERGEALLKARLLERLSGMAQKGEVLRTDFKTERRGGMMVVTLLAECGQEIGQTVED